MCQAARFSDHNDHYDSQDNPTLASQTQPQSSNVGQEFFAQAKALLAQEMEKVHPTPSQSGR